MSEKKVFVFCGDDCKSESMTKEQILAAIEQVITTGEISDVDAGFITTVKEQNGGSGLSFWVGTQAEYNALSEKVENCFYIIADDTTAEDINKAIEEMQKSIAEFEKDDRVIEMGDASETHTYFGGDFNWTYAKRSSGIVEMWGKSGDIALNKGASYVTLQLPVGLTAAPIHISYGVDCHAGESEHFEDTDYYNIKVLTKRSNNTEIVPILVNAGHIRDQVSFSVHLVGRWK